MINPVESAILRTILYADVFSFPLKIDEIHRYLIHDSPLSQFDIYATLNTSLYLQQHLLIQDDYVCLKSRQVIIDIRKKREVITQELWGDAIRYGKLLSAIPFVRMVALTGALAVRNPSDMQDDFDYLLITAHGRVWLARAFAVLLVRIIKLFGRELCPNYVLADDQLLQSHQDLYTAHELAQMFPIYGAKIYSKMLTENNWVETNLPNAIAYPIQADKPQNIRKIAEWLLSGWLGDMLEKWEYQRKLTKFRPRIAQKQSSAEINQNSVKGHFEDHGQPVMRRYHELLQEYGIFEQSPHALAGD